MANGPSDDGEVEGFGILRPPLPKNHWVYEPTGEPPSPIPIPIGLDRDRMRAAIWEAGRLAVGGATMSGRSPDFGPGVPIMALVVGLLGYAKPEAQLLGTEDPAPGRAAFAPHSPESGGGYPDPEKPDTGLQQGNVPWEKGKQP